MDLESTAKDFTRSAEVGEGGTIFATKRLRRVSFADTTAIHFFHKDEDLDTPPDAKAAVDGSSLSAVGNEPPGFRGDGTDGENKSSFRREGDEDGDDDDDGGDEHELFVRRDADSCSPCSTTGSVASIDDDNLFGPVSTSFIRSGGLSEFSYDNNHDITLDSTAFSMHFSNILPSDDRTINSVGSPRTPTGLSETNGSGGFLLHSDAEKMVPRFALQKANGYSSDMTLVAERSNKYDFGKISPTLEGLLAKVNETVQPESRHNEILQGKVDGKSIEACQNDEKHQKGSKGTLDGRLQGSNVIPETLKTDVSSLTCHPANSKADLPSGETAHESRFLRNEGTDNGAHKPKVSPSVLKTNAMSTPRAQSQKGSTLGNHSSGKSYEKDQLTKAFPTIISNSPAQMHVNDEGRLRTPTGYLNTSYSLHSPSETSISSLRAKRQQLLDDATMPFDSGHLSHLSSKRKVVSHMEATSLIKNCAAEFEDSEMGETAGSQSRSLLLKEFGKYMDSSSNMEMDYEISVNRHGNPGYSTRSMHDGANSGIVGTNNKSSSLSKVDKSLNIESSARKDSSPASCHSREQMQDIPGSSHEARPVRKLFSSPKSILVQKLSIQKGQHLSYSVNEPHKSKLLHTEMGPQTPVSCIPCSSSEIKKADNEKTKPEAIVSQDITDQAKKDIGSIVETLADQSPTFSFSSPDALKKATISGEPIEACKDPSFISVPEHERGNDTPSSHSQKHAFRDGYSPKKMVELDSHSIDTADEPGRNPNISKPVTVSEILARVVENSRLPFSQLTDNLNSQEIDALEDLVGLLKNARRYETLCNQIQSLGKNCNPDQKKRLSEIKLIKETLLYEQAKLQLRRSKHDGLLRKAQGMRSRIHEISELRVSWMKLMEEQSNLMPSAAPETVSQEVRDKASSMRVEVGEMDEKIKSLVKFFATHYSIGGNPGPDEVIEVVKGHFSKWNDCRAVCQRLQLWKLVDVVNQTDQCDIVLSYRDFLSHRFTITFTPASRFGAELAVNDSLVEKCFPNMRASAAFHFAFNRLKGSRKLFSLRCFQNETQACSFILGNLLDVLEEIQSVQIQVPTLVSSSFSLSSDSKLELQLHFVDMKSGKKIDLAVDLSHLNCAVYPSEPAELQMVVARSSPKSKPPSTEELNAAIRSLKGGRPALARLCCRISQLIQTSSPSL